MNDLIKQEVQSTETMIAEMQSTQKICEMLMQTKHYQKIGQEGIYAIVCKAKSMGISPLDALNGGIYFVQGKTEMSAQMMNRLIRQKGHSIQKDPKSTKENCILHGKRADNGDVWTVSFSVDDAKKAGLYKPNSPWDKYPDAMCFARALSLLARQLFPDIIVDTYTVGEISEAPSLHEPVKQYIGRGEIEELQIAFSEDPNPEEAQSKILQRVRSLTEIELKDFPKIMAWFETRKAKAKPIVEPVVAPSALIALDEDGEYEDEEQSPSLFDV